MYILTLLSVVGFFKSSIFIPIEINGLKTFFFNSYNYQYMSYVVGCIGEVFSHW